MDKTLVDKLAHQIVTFISQSIITDIEKIIRENNGDADTIVESIKKRLGSIAAEIPKTTPVVPVVTASASRAPSAEVLKDDNGVEIMCSGIIKKTGLPCKNRSKAMVDGKAYCGVHVKGARADTGAKPTKTGVPPKTKATWESTMNTSSSVFNISKSSLVGNGDIDDIDPEFEEY